MDKSVKVLVRPTEKYFPDGFFWHSEEMEEVINNTLKIARLDSNVLITGESGVGKESIADIIHWNSGRCQGPFIKVNCGAISESLIESELFGYVGGAFTGSNKQGKEGYFEAAQNGTIFLDEVAELPLASQARLLRVIQNREIVRVGSTSPMKLNIRIITATNKNLRKMVKNNQFREDLFYRISVVPVNIPPLRERQYDIVAAIERLTKKFVDKGFLKTFSVKAKDILVNYNWPGNMRELENVVEQVIVTTDRDIIAPEDIPMYIRAGTSELSDNALEIKEIIPLSNAIRELEKQLFTMTAAKCKSTRKVAETLKISQSSVMRKLRSLGIEIHDFK